MRYDLAVIGGGPAGYSAALEAVRLGCSVVLFEEDLLGGTCLNRGCVPTKFLAQAAHVYGEMTNGARYGICADGVKIDFAATYQKEEAIVAELRAGLQQLLLQKKIKVVRGRAAITGERQISCGNEQYEADHVIAATGSVPAKPFVPGAITSDAFLKLRALPGSVNIIGGGVIAVEFAHILSGLGVQVTLYIRGSRILRKWEKEIAVGLTQSMKKRGVAICTECTPQQFAAAGGAEVVLSAAGRVPNLGGLDTSLFELGAAGGIVADAYGRTKTPWLYAAGDVLEGSVQLAHVGMEQGKRAARHIAGKEPGRMAAVVSCIYTEPEIASVGLTEEQAKEKGITAVSAKQNLRANARTLISTQERCFIKLTAEKDSRKILGAQLMCERAGDIAAEIALAINCDLTVEDLCRSTRPHPSYCEAVTDVAEALREKLK